jgi:hypothetical protein
MRRAAKRPLGHGWEKEKCGSGMGCFFYIEGWGLKKT